MVNDVTLENLMDYILAVEEAVRRDIKMVRKEERSLVLGVIAGALDGVSRSMLHLRSTMEKNGESTPITEEQKRELRMALHGMKPLN